MLLLVAGVPAARGFVPIGPNANGGDSWQTPTLGYNPNPSVDTLPTGPKNIGEEYRQNKGVIVYAYDASFLDFFGSASNGVEPADQAFTIMNAAFTNNPTGLTNGLDGYSTALAEFPTYSQHINYEALALGLTDLKSLTLWALVEQMGLAWPERYVWDLHQAYLPAAVAPATAICPEDEEFEVVQRNLDIINSPLNQVQYSPYVNDTLYTFDIFYWPGCRIPAGYSYEFLAEPVPVDPFAQTYTSVAGTGDLKAGGFYTGLTRDDAAGLRYLLTSNNINYETPAAGSLLQATNITMVLLTSSDLGALSLAAQTNAPALLPGMFPGVVVGNSSSSWSEVCTTNIVVTVGPPPYGAPYPYNFGAPSYTQVPNCGFLQSYVTTFANLITSANLTNNPNISLASTNIILTYFTNTVVTTLTTSITPKTGYGTPYPPPPLTNVNYTYSTTTMNVPSGEYLILPTGACGFNILAEIALPTVFTTNLVSSVVNSNGFADTVSTVTSFTPHQFLVQQINCVNSAAASGLYEGIEKIKFVRANYDSLIGQSFQPVTNVYTMTLVSNSQTSVQRFQRVVAAPDILLTADDEPLTSALPFYNSFSRSISFDQANVLPNLAGPGVINSPATFTYNKAGNLFLNGSMTIYGLTTNSTLPYLNEITQTPFGVTWASFDGSTNDPVVYPNGTSIQNLVNQVLVQVAPPAGNLPDGTHGVAYAAIPFTATGGAFSPPFIWGLAVGSQPLPSGLTLSPAGVLSGTPAQAGTFDFTIQLTDSLGRSVNWNYQITIH